MTSQVSEKSQDEPDIIPSESDTNQRAPAHSESSDQETQLDGAMFQTGAKRSRPTFFDKDQK